MTPTPVTGPLNGMQSPTLKVLDNMQLSFIASALSLDEINDAVVLRKRRRAYRPNAKWDFARKQPLLSY